jgi:hypothetical protein
MTDPNRPAGSSRLLWSSVDRLIDDAATARSDGVERLLAHKLGPLGARAFENAGRPVPASLREAQRSASVASLLAPQLVRRIRETVDGELLLVKGPEVAALYPPAGRRFSDLDVLAPDAAAVQAELLRSGFVEVAEEQNRLEDHHHLHPIRFPAIWLDVEVHSAPNWPLRAPRPPVAEVLEAAVPSALAIDGVSAPLRLHHALLLAAHAWRHEPLHRLGDLLDVAVLAEGIPAAELEQTARRWGIGRIWHTTWGVVEALFYDGGATVPMRVWAAHLATARERTVLEEHLQRWLHPYWELPLHRAIVNSGRMVAADLRPADETWRSKLARTFDAIRHARTPAARRDAAAASSSRSGGRRTGPS